jgi:transcriptional regulator with XRE-family HTH domain
MNSRSTRVPREDYGFARVKDLAFDAVSSLWRKRQAQGFTQKELADRIGRDPAWISRQLRGPGNWTFRTFGALVEALDGEAEIVVEAMDALQTNKSNFDAYAAHDADLLSTAWEAFRLQTGSTDVLEPAA